MPYGHILTVRCWNIFCHSTRPVLDIVIYFLSVKKVWNAIVDIGQCTKPVLEFHVNAFICLKH